MKKLLHQKILVGPFGKVEICSNPNDFLKLIKRIEILRGNYAYFYQKNEYFPIYGPNEGTTTASTSLWKIVEQKLEKSISLDSLIKNANDYELNDETNLIEVAEEMAYQCAEHMGTPTHLIKIAHRTWLCASPSDFVIFYNQCGMTLANVFPWKNRCWKLVCKGCTL